MRVQALGFAAVKATRHLTREAVGVDARGVVGDRRWCLVDVARRDVLRTVRHPRLLALRADVAADGSLRLAAPGFPPAEGRPSGSGETVTCDYWGRSVALELQEGPHAALASAWLGRSVRLAEASPGGVVYGGAVSLIGAASAAALPGAPDPARFRANLVVAGADPFAEDAWLGHEVQLGAVVVRPRARTPRCAVVDSDPETGERDAALLEALVGRSGGGRSGGAGGLPGGPFLGVDGEVVVPGTVRVGDPVRVRRPGAAPGAS